MKTIVHYSRSVLIVFAVLSSHVNAHASHYNAREEIPETGTSILITRQLQVLIDKCSAEGGGYVFFPAGDYLTGSIVLKDNTYLHLSPGATLYGSTDIDDYTEEGGNSLIYAKGSSNVGITGQGTLNGNGDSFWRGKNRPYNRFAWLDGVSMISDLDSPNTDGIDPTSSSHIFVSNCYFELGDDAICPKSRGTRPTEYMVLENCIIKSDDSAIKLGTRSEAPIRSLVFNNIIIKDTQYGIAFFAKDGGRLENIRFSNITIESARTENFKDDRPSGSYPLFLDIERRTPDSPISAIRDIHFSNISINTHDGHCLFLGQPDQPIEDLYFSNIRFELATHRAFAGSKKPRGVRSLTDGAANDYSHIPANFTFAHVRNLNIDGLTIIDYDESNRHERHMIWGFDVHNVQVSEFANTLTRPNRHLPQFVFGDATGIDISDSRPTPTETPFVFLKGSDTRNVSLRNNNLQNLKSIVASDELFVRSELREVNNLKEKLRDMGQTERIQGDGDLRNVKAADKRPYIKMRGIKFNIPLDARTPSYSDNNMVAQQNIEHMWDMRFWKEYLDEMALNRLNLLTLWTTAAFPSLVHVPEYPKTGLDDVKRTTLPVTAFGTRGSGADMVTREVLA